MKSNLYYLYLLVTISSFSSCTNKNSTKICSKDDALITYEAFGNKLNNATNLSVSQLANKLQEWKTLEDTVLHFIITDSISDDSQNIKDLTRCAITRNEITDRMTWLVDNQVRSYDDIVTIQQSLNEYEQKVTNSVIFQNAETFFNALDKESKANKDANQLIAEYTNSLAVWSIKGFSSTSDIQEYIKEENLLFINFLNHLYDYDRRSIQYIINATSKVTELMYKASVNGNLSSEEVSIYMGIRTNRRLIQNAFKCMEAIKSGIIQTPNQAAMTISMLLNPYSNYNTCIKLRTREQVNELKGIGKKIESLITQLSKQGLIDEIKIDSFPNKLIKERILMEMK
ncbi:hypothetical protein [Bacteroides cellulosilyticus]|uniref:hypothetical protein n=1 Tax=Bacteroides cellulosilyticus TaxID=246787 RepID=UPI00356B0FD0